MSFPSPNICRSLAASSLLLAALVHGEQYISEEVFFSDIPRVTSAARMEQKITEAPVAMTIIDRDMIAASGATELAQIFQLVPGFFSYQFSGNQFGVVSRAPTSEYPGVLEVRVDGRSVYHPVFSSVAWTALGLSLGDIDYIEVIRGPASSVYGTNAFTGVVNIVTRSPVAGPTATITAETGTMDTRNVDAGVNFSLGDIDSRLTAQFRHNDGFPANDELDSPFWPVSEVRDGRETKGLTWTGLYLPSLAHQIELRVGLVDNELEVPGSDLDGYYLRQQDYTYQQFNWKYSPSAESQWSLQAYHNRLEFDEHRDLGLLSDLTGLDPDLVLIIYKQPDQFMQIDIDDGLSETYDMEVQQNYQFSPALRTNWGIGARRDRIRSYYMVDQHSAVEDTSWRAFANAHWLPLEWLSFNVGSLFEHNDIANGYLSPRAAVNLAVNESSSFRLSATRGYRNPSLLEDEQQQIIRFADGSPWDIEIIHAEDLDRAEIENWEVAYLWNRPDYGINLELRAYVDDVQGGPGLIPVPAPDFDTAAEIREEVYDWDTNGVDLQFSWKLTPGHEVFLQYAFADADGTRLAQPTDRRITRFLPRHSGGLLYQVEIIPEVQFSTFIYHRGAVAWESGSEFGAQTRVDLRLATRLPFERRQLKLEFLLHDLFNDYEDFSEDLHYRRRFYIRLGMDFD